MRGKIWLMLVVVMGLMGCLREVSWSWVDREIGTRFPEVRSISTDALAQWVSDSLRQPPLLLDVREVDEYAMSHLPGARHFPPGSVVEGLPIAADVPIVVYCSVGYRSAVMAERMRNAGFTNVYNLEGSIFKWANEGRQTVRAGLPVEEVHPYDAVWGNLLDASRRGSAK